MVGPVTVHHYAVPQDRESILRDGLLPRRPGDQRSFAEENGNPAGVYVLLEQAPVRLMPDMWTFTVFVDELRSDELMPAALQAFRLDGAVPADRLTLNAL